MGNYNVCVTREEDANPVQPIARAPTARTPLHQVTLREGPTLQPAHGMRKRRGREREARRQADPLAEELPDLLADEFPEAQFPEWYFFRPVLRGDVQEVRDILNSSTGASRVNRIEHDKTPLMHAIIQLHGSMTVDWVMFGYKQDARQEIVRLLVNDSRTDFAVKTSDNETALSIIRHYEGAFDAAKFILSDARTSFELIQDSLMLAVQDNCVPFAKLLLQHEKSRMDADRVRLAVLSKQSDAGLIVPDEVKQVNFFPMFRQPIVTQDMFDAVAKESYYEFQKCGITHSPRPARQPMIDLLTIFLREYGSVNDFDIPTVWS